MVSSIFCLRVGSVISLIGFAGALVGKLLVVVGVIDLVAAELKVLLVTAFRTFTANSKTYRVKMGLFQNYYSG